MLVLLAPFLSGAAIMGLELVGLRLLAPRFGASTYVWGGLLGTIMGALAVGYLLGGALADRRPRREWVFRLLLAGAAWVAADLLMTELVLDAAVRLGATLGPVLATAVLLAPPMLLLGSVSPFVVRLEGQLSSIGVTAGRVFALSTAGSLAGTFVASFLWIPAYGSRHTLRIFLAGLIVLGIAGLARPRGRAARAALAVALAATPFVVPDPPLPPGIVFAGESPYNTVYVEDQAGNRLLRLNDPKRGFHSVQLGRGMLTGAYYDVLYLGPTLARGRNVLVLGMGGGTTVRAYRRFYPGARVTAVEIDPVVVRVAHEYMGVDRGADLEVHVEDARPFLTRGSGSFDVIEVDLFAGGPYAPFYCLTTEFFEAVRARLEGTGLMSMNVY
ncbi:MAG TPA: fused MFS/spermidine synthase, partial [Vicinamibacteria bacterium]|nr:fused MFS/spermidine synthase [Vicinamibacteria bacterium]